MMVPVTLGCCVVTIFIGMLTVVAPASAGISTLTTIGMSREVLNASRGNFISLMARMVSRP